MQRRALKIAALKDIMKFCLGSRCQAQEGGLSARRRMAAIAPLLAVVPAIVAHRSHSGGASGSDFVKGLAVGVVFGVAILLLLSAFKRNH